jgi:hypothetical protein
MALQRVVQQWRTATLAARCLDDGQVRRRHPQAAALHEVGGRQVATTQPRAGPVHPSTLARHGDLHDLRREVGQAQPPCGGQTARGGVTAVAQHPDPHPRGVGEMPVLDEEHAGCAAAPVTRSHASLDGVRAEADALRLGEGDDAVVVTEVIVE